MKPLTLHFLRPSAPCRSVLLLIKTLGLDVKIKDVDFFEKKEHLESSFLKMNPTHTVPVLYDNGFYLWESRAILAYLVTKYGKSDKLYPNDPKKRANVDKMLHFDGSSLYANCAIYFRNILFLGQEPSELEADNIRNNLVSLDAILKSTPYAAGDHLTIADISLLLTITTLDALEFDYSEHKHITAWVAKLKKELKHFEEAVQPGWEIFKDLITSKRAEIEAKK